jgi:UDP-glucose 4-epimerase
VQQLVETPEAAGRIFNIGSDQPVTIRDLAMQVAERIDPELRIEYLPYHAAYGNDFEDVQRRVPDVSRLKHTIGRAPSAPLGRILDEIIASKRSVR